MDEIRRNGYSQWCVYQVALRVQPHVQTIAGQELKDQLLNFLAEESASLAPGERLLGSSESLESSLGKLKSLEGDFDKTGFTSLLATFGAMVGKLTPETIFGLRGLWSRLHNLSEPGENSGINGVGFRIASDAFSNVSHLSRVDDCECNAVLMQQVHQQRFVAAGGFHDDDGLLSFGQRFDPVIDLLFVVTDSFDGLAFLFENVDLVFGNIDTNER